MRLVKVLGAVLVVVLAFSAVAVSSASASSFIGSNTGLLSIKGDGGQLFVTPVGGIFCTTLTGHGFVTATIQLSQLATVLYSGCTTPIGTVDQPIPARYLFLADGGLVHVEAPIVITILITGLACTVTVPPQGGLETSAFDNELITAARKAVLVLGTVSNIESSDVGAVCPVKYTSNKTGKYTGNALVEEVGGSVEWAK